MKTTNPSSGTAAQTKPVVDSPAGSANPFAAKPGLPAVPLELLIRSLGPTTIVSPPGKVRNAGK
jgi:hypothetical protein